MALPIKPTEPIGEQMIEQFLKDVEYNNENPGTEILMNLKSIRLIMANKEQFSKIGKTTKMTILAPCPECRGVHKDLEFKAYNAKKADKRHYTHEAKCPGTNGKIMADLTGDYR